MNLRISWNMVGKAGFIIMAIGILTLVITIYVANDLLQKGYAYQKANHDVFAKNPKAYCIGNNTVLQVNFSGMPFSGAVNPTEKVIWIDSNEPLNSYEFWKIYYHESCHMMFNSTKAGLVEEEICQIYGPILGYIGERHAIEEGVCR